MDTPETQVRTCTHVVGTKRGPEFLIKRLGNGGQRQVSPNCHNGSQQPVLLLDVFGLDLHVHPTVPAAEWWRCTGPGNQAWWKRWVGGGSQRLTSSFGQRRLRNKELWVRGSPSPSPSPNPNYIIW